MKPLLLFRWFLVLSFILSACEKGSSDRTGPEISDIKTSGNVLVISDCSGTSVIISARITDPSGVESALFWYRIGADQQFAPATMKLQGDVYTISMMGADFLGKTYGTLEFYIAAQDAVGNLSQSPVNQDVQFLPCVNN